MRWKAVCGYFVLICTAGGAAGETRSILTSECSYTLPAKGWEWLDPRTGPKGDGHQTIVLARNRSGLTFMLRVTSLQPGYKPGITPFAGFEAALLKDPQMTKLGSRTLTFKGVAAYQVDVQAANGCVAARCFYANDRFYCLMVGNQIGQTPTKEAEAIFQGFNFTGKPRPMVPVQTENREAEDPPSSEAEKEPEEKGMLASLRKGKLSGGSFFGLGSVGFVAVIIFGAWILIRIRS